MTPTKFSILTNNELMDRLSKIVVKQNDYYTVLNVEPDDAADMLIEARNRIEAYENIKCLFERPACAKMSLEISTKNTLELDIKVKI